MLQQIKEEDLKVKILGVGYQSAPEFSKQQKGATASAVAVDGKEKSNDK